MALNNLALLGVLVVTACGELGGPTEIQEGATASSPQPTFSQTPSSTLGGAPLAYVAASGLNRVFVISTVTNQVITAIEGFSSPWGVVITPDGASAYVANRGAGTVSVISTETNTVVATVVGLNNPLGMAVTPGGDFVYVANQGNGTVSVISTETNTVVATVEGFTSPRNIAITPDGEHAYVTNQGTVSVILTETNLVVDTVVGLGAPWDVAITPDGTRAYVTSIFSGVSVILTGSNTVLTNVGVPFGPGHVAITPDGAFAYVTSFDIASRLSVISTLNNAVVTSFVPGGPDPQDVAITPDGSSAYLTFLSLPRLQEVLTDTHALGATVDYEEGYGASDTHLALTPPSPLERIDLLIADVQALIDGGVLPARPAGTGLIRKLDEAKKSLNKGNVGPATNKLGDFIDQVDALVNGGKLPPADGQALIDTAQSIIDQLSA
jgi:YVTN family beta-propeller protein